MIRPYRRPLRRPFLRPSLIAAPGAGPTDAIEAAAPTAWWSADTGVTEVGGGVSLWSDKTGNKPDLEQTTAANRPAYNATALNGAPGLAFDGVNDFMSCLPDFQYGANPVSVVFVASISSYANSSATVYRNYNTPAGGLGIIGRFDANPGKFYMYLGGVGAGAKVMVHDYSIVAPSGVLIFIVRYGRSSGQQSAYINNQGSSLLSDNIADTEGRDATPGSSEPFVVGARGVNTNIIGMTLGDLAVWENRLLTDAEVNAIGAQLATKYGVTFTGP